MDDQQYDAIIERLGRRLAMLYGPQSASCLEGLEKILGDFNVTGRTGHKGPSPARRWDEADCVLITYGDMVRRPGRAPLATLTRFLIDQLRGAINHVHILPFCPYSSDDGFSVIDYRRVDPALGDWADVEALGENFSLMFDLVLNHCSRQSDWFRQYQAGKAPYDDYFIAADPQADLTAVVRPRSLPLLTPVTGATGEKHVWTTFSDDQMDLNFANPAVLLEFIDILLAYVAHGARIIRLDAIAFLWKEPGTSCLHLPQTHAVVKLMRDVLEMAAPEAIVLTETNVPHTENVAYFGAGDEAHMVYQFSLAPLILLALLREDASALTRWASTLTPPPEGCTYLNFTASHDGIGMRPLEGLASTEEVQWLADQVRSRGGRVSTRRQPDGTDTPYELNITYYSALRNPAGKRNDKNDNESDIDRFLCSQAIMLAIQGIPAVYFHSLMGTRNNEEGVEQTGRARTINRLKWDEAELCARLDDRQTIESRVFDRYRQMLRVRAAQPTFHPDRPQTVPDLGGEVFGVIRHGAKEGESILTLHNVTGHRIEIDLSRTGILPDNPWLAVDVLTGERLRIQDGKIALAPCQVRWLREETGSQ